VSREREAKLPVKAGEARQRLEQTGAEELEPRHLEENWVLDTDERGIRGEGRLLRVRRALGRWTLTIKGPAREEGRHKVREERETEVDSGEVLLQAMAWSGLRIVWRYEKYRTHYRLGTVHVALDETPIGDYLEMEGEEGRTEEAARSLGYDPMSFVAESYASLHARYLEERGLPPGDMLFPKGASPAE
jgi:adenylate cyclase class 2